ncbi:hypothetical protein ABL78_4063 [Leptomonas seymouri]|uniref:Uncharacterized protein n=1 Tax=Leptomonas seymouri TaxID=5684 RepID=A0A0N1I5B4_LEPSE|nr:hypothetical protein ABL78_4063 [Leptomonas seymouri]|eukprot:KPI86873.1 hypothetical protein ABL78_4063 [Leptomonas seymouri]
MYCHDPSVDSFAGEGEAGPSPGVVHDAHFGSCRVWRPVEGPPLPRRYTAHRAPHPPPSLYATGTSVAALGTHDGAHARQPSVPLLNSPPHPKSEQLARTGTAQMAPEPVRAFERCVSTPPRGQLLRRGKGGLDDVLKNARAAQSLFYSLQERRLKAEYRRCQRELKAELDQQRHHKRMLELSAYQEELVNLYGPTMRDIIADTFFDDGHDPVLEVLKAKREAPSSYQQGFRASPSEDSKVEKASHQLWVCAGNAVAVPPTPAQSQSERAIREREMLLRALDERRSGRRTRY